MPLSITNQTAGVTVQKKFIGFGDEAIANTLNIMKDIINKSSQDYYVRRWAEQIVGNSGKCDIDKVRAIFFFLANNTRYLKDPHGFELLKTPKISLELIEIGDTPQLDCDDYVILSLSLLKSIGYPVAMRAIAMEEDKKLKHVYGIVKTKQGWIPLDLTKPENDIGWEYPYATRIVTTTV